MEFISYVDKRKCKFIPESDWNKDIKIIESRVGTDLYDSYTAELNIKGTYIVCKDIENILNKPKGENISFINQTHDEYEQRMKEHDFSNDQWIFESGKPENGKTLHSDNVISIFPDIKWDYSIKNDTNNINNLQRLHILTIPNHIFSSEIQTIRTIRDLRKEHIPLLIHIRDTTYKVIDDKFPTVGRSKIKAYIHYPPSTFHLHVHFAHVDNTYAKSSIEYSHSLDSVIRNLSIDSDYYKYDMSVINFCKCVDEQNF